MSNEPNFRPFPKIPRYFRDIVITEKIDGTNGVIEITYDLEFGAFRYKVGSRKRWITPDDDNFGFARWVTENIEAICMDLGPGVHHGEWWGKGIQRGYGQDRKRFSLFNTHRFGQDAELTTPDMDVVPILYQGPHHDGAILAALDSLREKGSVAAPGFDRPEGVVIYHRAGNLLFKATLDNDEVSKTEAENFKALAEAGFLVPA